MNTKRIALGVVGVLVAVCIVAFLYLNRERQQPVSEIQILADHRIQPGGSNHKSAGSEADNAPAMAAEARSMGQQQSSNKENILRSKYVQSPKLPDGVAFWALLQNLSSYKPSLANAWVRTEMGLSDKDSEAFLARFRTTYKSYQTEFVEASNRLACSEQVLAVSHEELYTRLERLDDLTYSLAEQHLKRLKTELGREMANRLQEALDNSKLRISHSTFRQDVAHRAQGLNPEHSIALTCELLNRNQQGSK